MKVCAKLEHLWLTCLGLSRGKQGDCETLRLCLNARWKAERNKQFLKRLYNSFLFGDERNMIMLECLRYCKRVDFENNCVFFLLNAKGHGCTY